MTHNPNDPNATVRPEINPSTGLQLIDDTWLDVGGSPYGVDIYEPPYTPHPTYEPWPTAGCGEPW